MCAASSQRFRNSSTRPSDAIFLEAIERFTYLGSGFNLAMEDLEIRGAGNILGTEQHGYIASIGFDLYCRILKEAIRSLSP